MEKMDEEIVGNPKALSADATLRPHLGGCSRSSVLPEIDPLKVKVMSNIGKDILLPQFSQ